MIPYRSETRIMNSIIPSAGIFRIIWAFCRGISFKIKKRQKELLLFEKFDETLKNDCIDNSRLKYYYRKQALKNWSWWNKYKNTIYSIAFKTTVLLFVIGGIYKLATTPNNFDLERKQTIENPLYCKEYNYVPSSGVLDLKLVCPNIIHRGEFKNGLVICTCEKEIK